MASTRMATLTFQPSTGGQPAPTPTTTSSPDPRALRRAAAEIGENIADMMATQNRMAERSGWDDPRIAQIEADIDLWSEKRTVLLARARSIESGRGC